MRLGLPFPDIMGGTQRSALASSHPRVYNGTTQLTNGSRPTSSCISGFNRWCHHGNSGANYFPIFCQLSFQAILCIQWAALRLRGAVGGGGAQTHTCNNCPGLWRSSSLVSLLDVEMWRSEDKGQATVMPSTVGYQHLGGRGKRSRF